VHTWPEYGFAAVDFFTCGEVDAGAAIRRLEERFGAGRVTSREIERGVLGVFGQGPGALAGPGSGERAGVLAGPGNGEETR
jgi:hypothetical protein